MTATVDEQIRESLLAAGRQPRMQSDILDATDPPVSQGPGYDVRQVSRVAIGVHVQQGAPLTRWVLTVPTFDAASTYSLQLPGIAAPILIATPATQAALWTSLSAAVIGLALTDWVVDSTSTSLTLTGARPPGEVLKWTASAGSPVLALETDALGCRVRLYGSRAAATFGDRLGDDATLARARAWSILHGPCGSAADWTVDVDGGVVSALPVSDVDYVRPYVSDVVAPDDLCVPGALTIRDPIVTVAPDILGAS